MSRPKRIVVGFAFGHRGLVNGVLEPGLSNEEMARCIVNSVSFGKVGDHLVSVQVEIGTAMRRIFGRTPDHEVTEHLLKAGVYLDTDEVARQMSLFVERSQKKFDASIPVYVVAQEDHLPRVLRTLKKHGVDAMPMTGGHIPYDPESDQLWTRYRFLFRMRERLAPLVLTLLGRK